MMFILDLLLSIFSTDGHKNKSTLFCKHNYNLVNEFTIPSKFDMIIESGRTPNTHTNTTRIYITDYKCDKCRKLKRLKEKTLN